MKKFVSTFLFSAFAVSILFAQTTKDDEKEFQGFIKGDFIITGGVSYGSTKNGNLKSNKFTFSPKTGYFISDNVSVGLVIGLGIENNDEYVLSSGGSGVSYVNSADIKTTSINPGMFGRYYFSPKNRFSLFTELALGYLSSKTEVSGTGFIIINSGNPEFTSSTLEITEDGFFGRFSPGINYFISESFALEASLGLISYTTIESDIPGSESTDNFNISADMANINFGLVYRF